MTLSLQILLPLLLAVALLFLYRLLLFRYRRQRALKALHDQSFPQRFKEILEKIPHYRAVPDSDRLRLYYRIQRFLYLKKFVPKYIELNDEIRVTVAFYSAFMSLHMPEETFDTLRTVVVYPYQLIIDEPRRFNSAGSLVLEGLNVGATMIIAWNSLKKEIFHPKKHNLLVHELAHELDYESGAFNGIPPMSLSKYQTFGKVFFRHFQKLQKRIRQGRFQGKYKFLGAYAATNEAEFFAVASELYFERPNHLKKHFSDLYEVLENFYQLDMARHSFS